MVQFFQFNQYSRSIILPLLKLGRPVMDLCFGFERFNIWGVGRFNFGSFRHIECPGRELLPQFSIGSGVPFSCLIFPYHCDTSLSKTQVYQVASPCSPQSIIMPSPVHLLSLGLPFTSAISLAPTPTQPYSQWMATSFLSKGQSLDRHYASAVLYEGLQRAGSLHSDPKLLSQVKTSISRLVSQNGTLIGWDKNYFSLDDIRVGNNLLWAYQESAKSGASYADVEGGVAEEKYRKAASGLREQFNRYPRTPSGGFWHRDPQYKNQMWLDGLYMAEPFYATWTSLFDKANVTAWNDIALQFDLVEQHCRNESTGLLVHGYDESKTATWAKNEKGAAPHVWDRAVGWYFMALVEVLQVYPKELPGYTKLKGYLTNLAAALEKAQDQKSGGWWLVMDEPYPGMKGNYIESSGMAMFVYGYLKGIRTGLLEEKYKKVADKGWMGMLEKFVKEEKNGTVSWEGTVQVGSLNGDGSYEVSIPCFSKSF